jgi:hypothetical protein
MLSTECQEFPQSCISQLFPQSCISQFSIFRVAFLR